MDQYIALLYIISILLLVTILLFIKNVRDLIHETSYENVVLFLLIGLIFIILLTLTFALIDYIS